MKLTTVINKLKKEFNYEYKEHDCARGIVIGNMVLTFIAQDGKAWGFCVSPSSASDYDVYTDCFSGSIAANFKQALTWLRGE